MDWLIGVLDGFFGVFEEGVSIAPLILDILLIGGVIYAFIWWLQRRQAIAKKQAAVAQATVVEAEKQQQPAPQSGDAQSDTNKGGAQ